MHRDLVENKGWLTEEEYKEGLALAQLAPGPLAAQLGIYYRLCTLQVYWRNTCRPGFCAAIVYLWWFLLGMAYQLYGGLAWMQAVFLRVGAAVIGIIAMSSYKLTVKIHQ